MQAARGGIGAGCEEVVIGELTALSALECINSRIFQGCCSVECVCVSEGVRRPAEEPSLPWRKAAAAAPPTGAGEGGSLPPRSRGRLPRGHSCDGVEGRSDSRIGVRGGRAPPLRGARSPAARLPSRGVRAPRGLR